MDPEINENVYRGKQQLNLTYNAKTTPCIDMQLMKDKLLG